jgi:hypothetical protein
MVAKVATQDSRQGILEHFKSHFCGALGTAHSRSFNESWAESDLRDVMHSAADNAPLFIEAFFDACEDLRRRNRDWFVPDPTLINPILIKHGIGYDIRPPDLLLREHETQPVSVPERPPTLAERAVTVFQASLHRSEQLLSEGRPREAVQEILWLLETVTTAFRGIETDSGTAEGKYFNQIVRYLRSKRPGTTLDRVLEWITSVHGYLSSPTGGGVRHGLDLSQDAGLVSNEARLFCNLIRSRSLEPSRRRGAWRRRPMVVDRRSEARARRRRAQPASPGRRSRRAAPVGKPRPERPGSEGGSGR